MKLNLLQKLYFNDENDEIKIKIKYNLYIYLYN